MDTCTVLNLVSYRNLKTWILICGCCHLWKKGGSGVGIGNFQEIGPLDTSLKPRNSTWLQKVDLLFVVNLLS